MSGFATRLALTTASEHDDGRWVLLEDLVYDSDIANCRIIVPAGFETDLASVPRLPLVYWLTGGKATAAAVVHDWLYTLGKMPRDMADQVFREACRASKVSGWTRFLMWAGVRIGGAGHYADDGKPVE